MLRVCLRLTVATVLLLSSWVAAEAAPEKAPVKVKALPDGFAFVDASQVSDLHPVWRGVLTWPTGEELEKQKATSNRRVQAAKRNTIRWLKLALRDEWMPEATDVDVLPLEGAVDGNDAVRLRYGVEDCAFQVTSISSAIYIVIKDRNDRQAQREINEDTAKSQVFSTVDKFFREPEKIKEYSVSRIQKVKSGFIGHPTITSGSPHWWEATHWWTDGTSVLVMVGKEDQGPRTPTLHKHWFSDPQNVPERGTKRGNEKVSGTVS